MNRIALFAVAAASIAAPAFAEPATELNFVRDGVEYHATSVEQQDGVRLINGYEVGSNRKFNLRVQNGYVTGDYDGDSVAYTAPAKSPRTKK
jgi:hypothetical protein